MRVVVTAEPLAVRRTESSGPPPGVVARYIKKPDPRSRHIACRTSHSTLLYLPDGQRRSSASSEKLLSEEEDPLSPNSRRKSVTAGAPAIGFRPVVFERYTVALTGLT